MNNSCCSRSISSHNPSEKTLNKVQNYEENINITSNNNSKNDSNYKTSNSRFTNKDRDNKSPVNSVYAKKAFFQVYLRRILISKQNVVVIYNIEINDVSDVLSLKLKIKEEKEKDQKLVFKLSHEFKNYLNSIICLIEHLKEVCPAFLDNNFSNCISQEVRNSSHIENQQYKKIKEEVGNIIYLLENLSNYLIFLARDISYWSNISDIKNKKFESSLVDMNQISSTCLNILRSLLYCNMAKLKKIKPEIKYDPMLHTITLYSDQEKINQILINFLSNAVKFTAEGFIRLLFKLKADKKIIKISVEDSGKGIEVN